MNNGNGNEWELLTKLIANQNAILERLTDNLERLAIAVEKVAGVETEDKSDRARYYATVDDLPTFDWASIGARIVSSDNQGATVVMWREKKYKRRFKSYEDEGPADIWFSCCVGKDPETNKNLYDRLIKFAPSSSKELKVKKLDEGTRDYLQSRPTPQPQPTPAPQQLGVSATILKNMIDAGSPGEPPQAAPVPTALPTPIFKGSVEALVEEVRQKIGYKQQSVTDWIRKEIPGKRFPKQLTYPELKRLIDAMIIGKVKTNFASEQLALNAFNNRIGVQVAMGLSFEDIVITWLDEQLSVLAREVR